MGSLRAFIGEYLGSVSSMKFMDMIEILLIAVLVYQFILWVRDTRAYSLLKGILVVLIFMLIAFLLKMNTILWIAKNAIGYALTAVLVIFQPELRKALEELGHKKIMRSILPIDNNKVEVGRFGDRTLNEIVRASFEMGEAKTGALIVIEADANLNEYVRTGIAIDSVVSSQLLLNILSIIPRYMTVRLF